MLFLEFTGSLLTYSHEPNTMTQMCSSLITYRCVHLEYLPCVIVTSCCALDPLTLWVCHYVIHNFHLFMGFRFI